MTELYAHIREELAALAEPELARFTEKLLRRPGEDELSGTAAHVLGVRLPALRKLAKQLSRENWRESVNVLSEHILKASGEGRACGANESHDDVGYIGEENRGGAESSAKDVRRVDEEGRIEEPHCSNEAVCLEEVMLWGFLVGNAMEKKRAGLAEQFELIRQYVPRIDNWSLCDSFCASLKFAKEFPAETWEFIAPFLRSDEEYEIRFGVVMIINYFITEEYIDRLFEIFDSIKHEGYYVKMAVAWAVSICYVKFPQKTQCYLEHNGLDDFTYNKALQKIVESRCVSDETKQRMRRMKRR